MTESIAESRIALPDFEMAISHCGTGPLVVCLHGFPDTGETWDGLLPALAGAGYHAVAPFMRGYAPSGVPVDDAYNAYTLAKDVVALADALAPGFSGFHKPPAGDDLQGVFYTYQTGQPLSTACAGQ